MRGFRVHRSRLPTRNDARAASPAGDNRPDACSAAARDGGNHTPIARNGPGSDYRDRTDREAGGKRTGRRHASATGHRARDHAACNGAGDNRARRFAGRAHVVTGNAFGGAYYPFHSAHNYAHNRGSFTLNGPVITRDGAHHECFASSPIQNACCDSAFNKTRLFDNGAVISNHPLD